ncbi:MAG: hypothetical protein QNJ63_00105 [Calothrix sp. MO_192.B10]|nr:hypothetical protein [Calothrix sp. MO_192.B10]
MKDQENLDQKLGRLFGNMTGFAKKVTDAVQEGLSESPNLVCVQNGILNFDLIEQDIKRIHKVLRARGDVILGSHLTLDDKQDFMEITTYTERKDRTFSTSVETEVRRVTNIPEDVLDELKTKGRVELHLKY